MFKRRWWPGPPAVTQIVDLLTGWLGIRYTGVMVPLDREEVP
jgi:hypothetical protein